MTFSHSAAWSSRSARSVASPGEQLSRSSAARRADGRPLPPPPHVLGPSASPPVPPVASSPLTLTITRRDVSSLLRTLARIDPRGDHTFVRAMDAQVAAAGGQKTLRMLSPPTRGRYADVVESIDDEVAFSQTQHFGELGSAAVSPEREVPFSQTPRVAANRSSSAPLAAQQLADSFHGDDEVPFSQTQLSPGEQRNMTHGSPTASDDTASSPPRSGADESISFSPAPRSPDPGTPMASQRPRSVEASASSPSFVNPYASGRLLEAEGEHSSPTLADIPAAAGVATPEFSQLSQRSQSAPQQASPASASAASPSSLGAMMQAILDEPDSPAESASEDADASLPHVNDAPLSMSSLEYSVTPPAARARARQSIVTPALPRGASPAALAGVFSPPAFAAPDTQLSPAPNTRTPAHGRTRVASADAGSTHSLRGAANASSAASPHRVKREQPSAFTSLTPPLTQLSPSSSSRSSPVPSSPFPSSPLAPLILTSKHSQESGDDDAHVREHLERLELKQQRAQQSAMNASPPAHDQWYDAEAPLEPDDGSANEWHEAAHSESELENGVLLEREGRQQSGVADDFRREQGWRSRKHAAGDIAAPAALHSPSSVDPSHQPRQKPFQAVQLARSASVASNASTASRTSSDAGASPSRLPLPSWRKTKSAVQQQQPRTEQQQCPEDGAAEWGAINDSPPPRAATTTRGVRSVLSPSAGATRPAVTAAVTRPRAARRSKSPLVDPAVPASAVAQPRVPKGAKRSNIAPLTLTNYLVAPSSLRSPAVATKSKRAGGSEAPAREITEMHRAVDELIDLTESPQRARADSMGSERSQKVTPRSRAPVSKL